MIVVTRTRRRAKRTVHIENVPSPEKIREVTAEIRKSWTPGERRRRAAYGDSRIELIKLPPLPHITVHLYE